MFALWRNYGSNCKGFVIFDASSDFGDNLFAALPDGIWLNFILFILRRGLSYYDLRHWLLALPLRGLRRFGNVTSHFWSTVFAIRLVQFAFVHDDLATELIFCVSFRYHPSRLDLGH